MEFICSRNKISEAILNVQKAVSAKSCMTALEGILIKSTDSGISLCGYDLELGITTTIDANVIRPGSIVLGAKILSEIIRKLPDDEVHISINDKLIATINCGNCEFSILGISPDEFPELPSICDSHEIFIQNSVLKSMIKQTLFAISVYDSKPIHTGTLFCIEDGVIRLISVDGYRLALRKENISTDTSLSFVVPGKTLSEVLKLLPDNDEQVEISAGKKHIIFKIGTYSIISRLLEGEFLDYRSTIPQSFSTEVCFKTKDCINSTERVSLMVTDRLKSPVRCVISDDRAKLSCTTSIGKATDEFLLNKTGENIEIGFNHKYLLDALKNVESDEITDI